MEYLDAVRAAFDEELSNILSHTKEAGFLRAGRRPFKAETLIKKTGTMYKQAATAAQAKKGSKLLRYGVPAVGGAIIFDQAGKAIGDYKRGREYRRQMAQQGM